VNKKILVLFLLLLTIQGCGTFTAWPWDLPWYDICGEHAPNGPRGKSKETDKNNETNKKEFKEFEEFPPFKEW